LANVKKIKAVKQVPEKPAPAFAHEKNYVKRACLPYSVNMSDPLLQRGISLRPNEPQVSYNKL
jgi:hypothetical protein